MSIGLFVAGAAIPIYRGRGFTGEAVLAFTSEDDDHMSAFGDANMWRSEFNGETKTHDVDLGPGARADFVTWGELQNWHMVYEKMRREQHKTTFWAENIFKKFALDIGMRLSSCSPPPGPPLNALMRAPRCKRREGCDQ